MTKNTYLRVAGYRRTIVVGDIHGCFTEFISLLKLIDFSSDDLLVVVGDFVDRGPQSWKVAKYIRDTANIFSVLG